MEFVANNCSKIRLWIYQFAFCCFFSGAMVSCFKEVFWFLCFVVDFRKVPKHFLSFNTDKAFQKVGQILVWVAWVEILAWVKILSWVAWFKKTAWVNVLLSNHTLKRTRRLTYIIRYNCTTKRIQPSLQLSFVIPNLFRASLIQTYM